MKSPQKHTPLRWFILSLLLCLLFTLFTLSAFGMLRVLYHFLGTPPPIVAHMLTALLSYYLFFVTLQALLGMKRRNSMHEALHTRLPRTMMDALDALDRIAQGDFDVLLDVDEHDIKSGLSSRINSMAQSLRSMEHMRQDFVSDVSHEIQSPLTSIAGFAALLRQEGLTDEQRAHYIDVIETESRRLSKLSDNLLRLSLLDANSAISTQCPYRLDKQLEETVLTLEPQWAEKDLMPDLQLEKVEIVGDIELLSQVWRNLIHNAIKFTPEGGSISIRLTCNEEAAECAISDTGIGIPAENLIHIFERFYKVDKARDRSLGGNGLGLSLVKRIVEYHGGQVTVHSEEDIGTTFTVTLPRRMPPETQASDD